MADLRHLPPVEPVERPSRLSVTWLEKFDNCRRSAYLGLKYRGGPGSHPMDRGSAFHEFAAMALLELIANGERSLYEPGFTQGEDGELVPEDPKAAAREVASLTAAMVEGILEERRDLALPQRHKDDVREMAYHWAVGSDVDPEKVVAVERKFVLDLECGWPVVGKVDVATIDGQLGGVDDYKTSFAIPAEAEFEDSFQTKLYALLLAFGEPVEERPCAVCAEGKAPEFQWGPDDVEVGPGLAIPAKALVLECPACENRRTVEERLPSLGDGLTHVRAREVYPRYLREDGTVRFVEATYSRTDLADFRADLEALGREVSERLESWEFPAVAGSHCSQCPCEAECPLPRHLRSYAGAINSPEQAAEAAELNERLDAKVKATWKEIRNFASVHGPVRYGRDRVREFNAQESTSVDRASLEAAVEEAVTFGVPFEYSDHVRRKQSTVFRSRKLSREELEAEQPSNGDGPVDVEAERDARFGAEAPY